MIFQNHDETLFWLSEKLYAAFQTQDLFSLTNIEK